MGEAKRRGTFEERKTAAIARDKAAIEERRRTEAERWAAMSEEERRRERMASVRPALLMAVIAALNNPLYIIDREVRSEQGI